MFENIDWPSFSKGIAIGLFSGLLVASIIWFRGVLALGSLRKQKEGEKAVLRGEIDRLQEHLHTQMKITSKGSDKMEKESEELKKTAEHLRIENASLRQKPGRLEVRQFEVYERAIQKMNSRAPGFGPAWQSALAESEAEQQEAESGVVGFVRKIFRGSTPTDGVHRDTTPTLEMHSTTGGGSNGSSPKSDSDD